MTPSLTIDENTASFLMGAIAVHALTLDGAAHVDGPVDRDDVDNRLYNLARSFDPDWWDSQVPGLNERRNDGPPNNLTTALLHLVDVHHRTLTGSRKHNAENIDWPECDCKTCSMVRDLLPDEARDALVRFRAEREAGR